MDLNIDQLDSEERRKINALLKERNDTNKDKGVEYIFRQTDEREEFLLGKKLDMNKIVKDDKAMMGESEMEFQERMDKRKLMQKMREDPMAIIQLNEQQAQKVALEKQKVHQKLSKTYNSKFQRQRSVSESSDSDSSDCFDKLRELLKKHVDNDDEGAFGIDLDEVTTENKNNLKRNRRSKTPERNKINYKNHSKYRKESRSKSRSLNSRNRKRLASSPTYVSENKHRRRNNRSKSRDRYESDKHKSSYYGTKQRNHERSRSIDRNQKSNRSRHQESNKRCPEKSYYRKHEYKSKLTKEEREQKLKEMTDNAREIELKMDNLDKMYKRQDQIETAQIEKNLKHTDEYMYKEIIKLNKNEFSLQKNINERNKQNNLTKLFKK